MLFGRFLVKKKTLQKSEKCRHPIQGAIRIGPVGPSPPKWTAAGWRPVGRGHFLRITWGDPRKSDASCWVDGSPGSDPNKPKKMLKKIMLNN